MTSYPARATLIARDCRFADVNIRTFLHRPARFKIVSATASCSMAIIINYIVYLRNNVYIAYESYVKDRQLPCTVLFHSKHC